MRELVNAGDIQRNQAQEWVDNLVERSRKSSEQILELVRHEVASQLDRIDPKFLESIANQVAEVLKKSAEAGRSATKDVTTHAGKAAKDATNRAGKTAKGVTTQASKTAKGVTAQAGKTATRARRCRHQGGPVPAAGRQDPDPQAEGDLDQVPRQEGRRDQELGSQEGRQLTSGARRRLDAELVRRGLVESRQEAQAAVAAGSVLVSGAPADKPARLVAPDEPVVLLGPPSPFVGRGGLKLEAALDRFPIAVTGRRALDAGASTGGFTDCLLQHGAVPRLRRRRRARAAPSGPARRSPGHRPGAHQRADPDRGRAPGRRPRLRALPARRGRSLLHLAAQRRARPDRARGGARTPTSSFWSSPSSRRAGPPSPGARA